MARRKELRNQWYKVSDCMMSALRDAAMKCSELSEKQRMKWRISTTHDEVSCKILYPPLGFWTNSRSRDPIALGPAQPAILFGFCLILAIILRFYGRL